MASCAPGTAYHPVLLYLHLRFQNNGAKTFPPTVFAPAIVRSWRWRGFRAFRKSCWQSQLRAHEASTRRPQCGMAKAAHPPEALAESIGPCACCICNSLVEGQRYRTVRAFHEELLLTAPRNYTRAKDIHSTLRMISRTPFCTESTSREYKIAPPRQLL